MAVGDRLATPSYNGTLYSDIEVTDETAVNGVKQIARLVKVVDDNGATVNPAAPAATDNGPAWTSSYGVSGARFTSADQSAAPASVTDAPATGQKLVVTDILVSVDTAMRVDFKEEATGTVVASIYMAANSSAQVTPRSKLKLATVNKKLQAQTSAAGNIAITAFYFSEA
jgi:hypothetical protein